mmetsp:Transcript_82275/g.145814  ORF Transcript_82275/g.145814 Transcript_82275/m.145814 type:complete len:326 (-) Transcript_82275:59-1036(-)
MSIVNDQAPEPLPSSNATSAYRDDDTNRTPRSLRDSQSRESLQFSESDSSRSSNPARMRRNAITCARAGDVEGLKAVPELAVYADEHGRTPLMYAAAFGHKEAVSYMLSQRCVNVNAKDKRGKTALHHICNRGRKMAASIAAEIAQLLLQATASVDARDCHGQTPLHLAADSGVEALMLTLLDAGADVNSVDVSGYTALDHSSSRQNRRGVSDILEAHGGEGQEENRGEEPDLALSMVINGHDENGLQFRCYSMGGSELGRLSVDVDRQLVGGLRMKVARLLDAPLQTVKLILPNGQLLSRSNNAAILSDFGLCSCEQPALPTGR